MLLLSLLELSPASGSSMHLELESSIFEVFASSGPVYGKEAKDVFGQLLHNCIGFATYVCLFELFKGKITICVSK